MLKWPCLVENQPKLPCMQRASLQELHIRETVAFALYYSSGMFSLAYHYLLNETDPLQSLRTALSMTSHFLPQHLVW